MMHRSTAAFALTLLSAPALCAAASPAPTDVTPAVAARIDGALQAVTGNTKGRRRRFLSRSSRTGASSTRTRSASAMWPRRPRRRPRRVSASRR